MRDGWHVLEPGVGLEWADHHQLLCDSIQSWLEGWLVVNGYATAAMRKRHFEAQARHSLEPDANALFVQNVVWNFAPGTLKSRILMNFAPAWIWLHAPHFRWFCLSGSPDNVKRDSDAHRDLVTSEYYKRVTRGTIKVLADVASVRRWATNQGGERVSIGFRTKLTGHHADGILVDDPDDAQGVHGELTRTETHGKWSRAIFNRVNSPTKSIRGGIQQRVHVNDWTWLVTKDGLWSPMNRGAFAQISVPLEYDPRNPCITPWGQIDKRTQPGETLHPRWFTPEAIYSLRSALGEYGFASQCNQNPAPLDGGMFSRRSFGFWRRADDRLTYQRPEGCSSVLAITVPCADGKLAVDETVISVDATYGSERPGADSVSITVLARIGERVLVLDDDAKPRGFDETESAIVTAIGRWHNVRQVLIEKRANGAAVIERLRKALDRGDILGPDGRAAMPEVIELNPEGGKRSRAAACMAEIGRGGVLLPEGAPWLQAWLTEVCTFPNAEHDDRVDSLTQALNHWRETSSGFSVGGLASYGALLRQLHTPLR